MTAFYFILQHIQWGKCCLMRFSIQLLGINIWWNVNCIWLTDFILCVITAVSQKQVEIWNLFRLPIVLQTKPLTNWPNHRNLKNQGYFNLTFCWTFPSIPTRTPTSAERKRAFLCWKQTVWRSIHWKNALRNN